MSKQDQLSNDATEPCPSVFASAAGALVRRVATNVSEMAGSVLSPAQVGADEIEVSDPARSSEFANDLLTSLTISCPARFFILLVPAADPLGYEPRCSISIVSASRAASRESESRSSQSSEELSEFVLPVLLVSPAEDDACDLAMSDMTGDVIAELRLDAWLRAEALPFFKP